jgi:hypothetical protein
MTTDQFFKMVNHESGLRGISEISSDMRDLLAQEAHDIRAAEALALFCYQAKKWIGPFAAALGGLDTVVFAVGTPRENFVDGSPWYTNGGNSHRGVWAFYDFPSTGTGQRSVGATLWLGPW